MTSVTVELPEVTGPDSLRRVAAQFPPEDDLPNFIRLGEGLAPDQHTDPRLIRRYAAAFLAFADWLEHEKERRHQRQVALVERHLGQTTLFLEREHPSLRDIAKAVVTAFDVQPKEID